MKAWEWTWRVILLTFFVYSGAAEGGGWGAFAVVGGAVGGASLLFLLADKTVDECKTHIAALERQIAEQS